MADGAKRIRQQTFADLGAASGVMLPGFLLSGGVLKKHPTPSRVVKKHYREHLPLQGLHQIYEA